MYKPWRWAKIKKCPPYQRHGLYILLAVVARFTECHSLHPLFSFLGSASYVPSFMLIMMTPYFPRVPYLSVASFPFTMSIDWTESVLKFLNALFTCREFENRPDAGALQVLPFAFMMYNGCQVLIFEGRSRIINGCPFWLSESCPHALQQNVRSANVTRVLNVISWFIVRVPLLPTWSA